MNREEVLKKPIFLDCANPEKILTAFRARYIQGVTTNPSLFLKAGFTNRRAVTDAMQALADGLSDPAYGGPIPISLEQDIDLSTSAAQMIREGRRLRTFGANVVVKIPVMPLPACYEAIKTLSDEGIPVNATLIGRWEQAVRAAQCGAAYVSPFIGRIDDFGHGASGLDFIRELVRRFEEYKIDPAKTKILASSIRGVRQLFEALENGADIATVPSQVLDALCDFEWNFVMYPNSTKDNPLAIANLWHPISESGLMGFHADFQKIPNEEVD